MAESEAIGALDVERARDYAKNVSRVGGALESLKKHDGWNIFLALFYRMKKDFAGKEYGDDHAALVEFKGDRKAIKLVEDLFSQLEDLMGEAGDAARALGDITGEEEVPRGIMLIEAIEDPNREA